MFESHAVQNQAVESQSYLYEGAYVRLDIRWHHNPVFVCEKAGEHFRIAGFEYAGNGQPLKAHIPTPVITGVLPVQK